MKIIYELNKQHIDELTTLYQKEWWTKGRSRSEVERCVNGSQLNIGILDNDGALVAYTRVLSDFTFKALVFDFIVSEDFRGKGLGDKLMNLIKSHEQLQLVKSIELYCLPDMCSFYEQHGFSTEVDGIQLMRKRR